MQTCAAGSTISSGDDVDAVMEGAEPEGDVEVVEGSALREGLVFTTDNAPAVAKAMRDSSVTRVPCCGHVISLAVKRVNNYVPAVRKWKHNVTKIVGNLNQSTVNRDLLSKEQTKAGISVPKAPI